MWFRAPLGTGAFLLLSLAVWMGTHASETPAVLGRWSLSYSIMLGTLILGAVLAAVLAGPLYRHVHGSRHNVAVLIVATALSLAGAEGVVRWLDLYGISYYADTERYQRAKLPDAELYYVHEPNTDAHYRYFRVRINSLGMRGAEISEKAPDELRLLFLGDSVTFGWGVEEEDTFAERVGSMLEERLGRPVRSLNSGVGSYNTQSEWGFLSRHGDRLEPDLVALVYVVNDIEIMPNTRFDPMAGARPGQMSPPELMAWLLGKSWAYRTIMHFRRYRQGTTGAVDAAALLRSRGWQASAEALGRIAEWCDTRNLPLVIYLARITPDPISDALAPALSTLGEEYEFRFVDPLAWFRDDDPRDVTNSVVDVHLNPAGHAIFAEGIANSIGELLRRQ